MERRRKLSTAEEQHCLIDLQDVQEVIQHFRDLISIGPMLSCDYELEMFKFKKKLVGEGYSDERVHQFVQLACFGTIYEGEIPPPIKNRGDYWEFLKIKSRIR